MKGNKSKRSEKKERKRARKRFETGNGKKFYYISFAQKNTENNTKKIEKKKKNTEDIQTLVNMESATTVRKIRIFFYCVKKSVLHGELFSELYFQSSSEFTFLWNLGKFKIQCTAQSTKMPMEFIQNCTFSTRQYKKKGTCLGFIFTQSVFTLWSFFWAKSHLELNTFCLLLDRLKNTSIAI